MTEARSKDQVLIPEFLARFQCLGDACEDTCCQSWGMQMDEGTFAKYRATDSALVEAVTGDPGARVMKRDPSTDFCVKFEGGLCGIQKQYGPAYLGDACALYPRSTRALGGQVVMTAVLSCPETARLALLDDIDPFAFSVTVPERLPASLTDYAPEGLTDGQALAIHRQFLDLALAPGVTAQDAVMRSLIAAESLERLPPPRWPDAVPFYLEDAASRLPEPASLPTDPVYVLQALCGLVAAAKKVHQRRLMQTIGDIEKALHVSLRWDTLAIAALPDSAHAAATLVRYWEITARAKFAPLLKRYVAAQFSLALLPFAGFGTTLPERVAVIGIRLATLSLALAAADFNQSGDRTEREIIRTVQSLSRFLDHLAEPEFSLQIYRETGWLQPARLRALLNG